jgi:hypothetical protein
MIDMFLFIQIRLVDEPDILLGNTRIKCFSS